MNSVSSPRRPCSRADSARRSTSVFIMWTTARPYPRQPDGNAPRNPLIPNEHGGTHGDARIQIDHVRDVHPDAPVRRARADRAVLVGAVDADAVGDPHPARLERILLGP